LLLSIYRPLVYVISFLYYAHSYLPRILYEEVVSFSSYLLTVALFIVVYSSSRVVFSIIKR